MSDKIELTNEQLIQHAIRCAEAQKKYIDKNRHIPLSNEVELKCIVCGKIIQPVDEHQINDKLNICMLHKGACGIIQGGFGSKYDMVEILIGIHDKCIKNAIVDGRIVWTFDRIGYDISGNKIA